MQQFISWTSSTRVGEFMLDNLGFAAGSISLLLGAVLLNEGVYKPDASQALREVGAAALLSLGLTTTWLVLKSKLEWRRSYKKYREGL